jgi:hypothetical protein
MKKLIVILQFLFFTCISIFAQETFSVELQRNSSLTINGTTNLLSFKLSQNGDKLLKRNFIITATQNKDKIVLSQNQQSILVRSFDSKNKMALRDFLKLVKADSYPNFNIQLNYFEIQPKAATNTDLSKANVSINITITGKTKQYNIPITSNHEGDLYTLNGKEKINIRDFGLIPPVEMLGLLRVNEWIDIDFHIICKINAYNSPQDLKTANLVKPEEVKELNDRLANNNSN